MKFGLVHKVTKVCWFGPILSISEKYNSNGIQAK